MNPTERPRHGIFVNPRKRIRTADRNRQFIHTTLIHIHTPPPPTPLPEWALFPLASPKRPIISLRRGGSPDADAPLSALPWYPYPIPYHVPIHPPRTLLCGSCSLPACHSLSSCLPACLTASERFDSQPSQPARPVGHYSGKGRMGAGSMGSIYPKEEHEERGSVPHVDNSRFFETRDDRTVCAQRCHSILHGENQNERNLRTQKRKEASRARCNLLALCGMSYVRMRSEHAPQRRRRQH
ncbi:hypothetical protein MAPG_07306 [Magnaporthiopsis poae ATCC 64411]|uniref:Uncharacterized protein n=1 Tax=Magnaporthiopsis poae (strain ATCC 64411 / 73-15) TaxID=644358 RepID=A0A0C4E4B4_MAGP6|nr:hypothetical protein MAPG_07306 [Magnaporthiopsis poae ATCC 64411]